MTAVGFESAFNFSDLQGLTSLRREGAAGTPEARRAVAQQFEALFLNLMLRQMRAAATVEGGVIDSERLALQQGMLDQQLALTMARGEGSGLSRSILEALGEAPAIPRSVAEPLASLPQRIRAESKGDLEERMHVSGAGVSKEVSTAPVEHDFAPESAAAFVDSVWPHAKQAADALGITPDVLVAQAALETGWGRYAIRDGHGRQSFNLFNLKATKGWNGPKAVVSTIEYSGSVPQRRREAFRMYRSLAEGFDDYVALVKSPRYGDLVNATSPDAYLRGLQRAGYATDPEYAEKIMGILNRGLPGRSGQVRSRAADTLKTMTEFGSLLATDAS